LHCLDDESATGCVHEMTMMGLRSQRPTRVQVATAKLNESRGAANRPSPLRKATGQERIFATERDSHAMTDLAVRRTIDGTPLRSTRVLRMAGSGLCCGVQRFSRFFQNRSREFGTRINVRSHDVVRAVRSMRPQATPETNSDCAQSTDVSPRRVSR